MAPRLKFDKITGLGMKGDVLTVAKRTWRSILQPADVAVYATPENLAANQEERKVLISSVDRYIVKGNK